MIHLSHVARVVLVALACTSCGASNGITGPTTDPSQVPPQRTVWGWVQDSAFRRISGAQIAVVGTGLSTVTGADGSYELTGGIASPVTVRVAKEGYITQTRTFNWPTGCVDVPCVRTAETFVLAVVGQSVDISGDYTMTLSADSACTDLPSEARSRTFTASIVPTVPARTQYNFTVGGGSLVRNAIYGQNGVAGDFITLSLRSFPYGPALVDQIGPNTYVTFDGTATSTVPPAPSVISAAFDGLISYCSLKRPIRLNDVDDLESCGDEGSRLEPTPSQPVTYASCYSKNHRMVLARR